MAVVLSGYSGLFHNWNWSLWYSWNIAESGAKHNKIKSNKKITFVVSSYFFYNALISGSDVVYTNSLCSLHLIITRRVPFLEQELITIAKSSGARVLFSLFCWQLFFFIHFLLLAIILPVLPSIDGFWRSLWYRPHFLIQIDILPNISRRHAITDRNTGNGWFKNGFQNNYWNICKLNFFDRGLLLTRSYWTKSSSWLSWSHHFGSIAVTVMTWRIAMEYLWRKWPRICPTCREHFPILSSFMTYHRICNYINTMGAASGAGTAYPSGAPVFTPSF